MTTGAPATEGAPWVDPAAVAALFDPVVVVAQAHVGELAFSELPAPARDRMTGFTVPLRRRTYTAGRLAAARATAAVTGLPQWLGADEHGIPAWPVGTWGSLSHTNEIALCVTSVAPDTGLGVDIEPLDSAGELHAAVRYVCTPAERERVAASARPAEAVLRVFCAKEALYKALPARDQRGLSMRSVELDWSEPAAPYAPSTLVAVTGPAPGAEARCAVIGTHMVAAVTLPSTGLSRGRPHPGASGQSGARGGKLADAQRADPQPA
ncbi:4'-phosphopantetheinyl transferase superfamily protein [Streptomyces sp. NA04227]|uniref:4'-phosphopantetheinyl transferase superfamily protein n=1 Tax=Streptomyces sp. NA04227 TaxID=2742136 RepID=UPI001590C35B|nr:4'-phosphopantetheinyl transferase superfamily protein [Streptomyces sp. NA04227]QKW06895.1 4'-phosphopantetheinyl transferase superfamily protein [Streptomyces sp. NA04227]